MQGSHRPSFPNLGPHLRPDRSFRVLNLRNNTSPNAQAVKPLEEFGRHRIGFDILQTPNFLSA